MKKWVERGLSDYPPGFNVGAKNPTWVPVVWQGIEYPSGASAARAARVSTALMLQWHARGITDYPEGYDPDCEHDPRWKPMMWRGVMHPHIQAAALASGVSYRIMREWAAQGITDYPESYLRRMKKGVFEQGGERETEGGKSGKRAKKKRKMEDA